MLHPGLRSFEIFLQSEKEREQLWRKGCNFIHQLLHATNSAPTSGDAAQLQSKFTRI